MVDRRQQSPYWIWESITVESLVDNRPLIEVLKKTNDSAAGRVAELENEVRAVQSELGGVKYELDKAQKSLATRQVTAARLDERIAARNKEISELKRRILLSIVVAWFGT